MNARGQCLHGCGCERFCLSRAKSSKDGRICTCSHEEARHELLGTDHRSAVVTAFDALRDAVAELREHGVTHYCAAPIVHNLLVNAPVEWRAGIGGEHGKQVRALVAGAAPPAAGLSWA